MRALDGAAFAAAWVFLAGCAPTASVRIDAGQPIALQNAGFESEPHPGNHCAIRWNCVVHAHPPAFRFYVDETSASEGRRSLCVQRVENEPWATATQPLFDRSLRGATLRLAISMRLEGTSGPGAGPWVKVHGPSGRNLFHDQRLVTSTRGWERFAIDFSVPAEAEIVEIGATLEGPGRMCMDDVRLEHRPPRAR